MASLSACSEVESKGTPDPQTIAKSNDRQVNLRAATEQALTDQIACKNMTHASQAFRAMIANGLIEKKRTDDDGTDIYRPLKPLAVMGFEVTALAGWESSADNETLAPFYHDASLGTVPPNFVALTLKSPELAVRRKVAALGFKTKIDNEWIETPLKQTTVVCFHGIDGL